MSRSAPSRPANAMLPYKAVQCAGGGGWTIGWTAEGRGRVAPSHYNVCCVSEGCPTMTMTARGWSRVEDVKEEGQGAVI